MDFMVFITGIHYSTRLLRLAAGVAHFRKPVEITMTSRLGSLSLWSGIFLFGVSGSLPFLVYAQDEENAPQG